MLFAYLHVSEAIQNSRALEWHFLWDIPEDLPSHILYTKGRTQIRNPESVNHILLKTHKVQKSSCLKSTVRHSKLPYLAVTTKWLCLAWLIFLCYVIRNQCPGDTRKPFCTVKELFHWTWRADRRYFLNRLRDINYSCLFCATGKWPFGTIRWTYREKREKKNEEEEEKKKMKKQKEKKRKDEEEEKEKEKEEEEGGAWTMLRTKIGAESCRKWSRNASPILFLGAYVLQRPFPIRQLIYVGRTDLMQFMLSMLDLTGALHVNIVFR